MENRKTTPTGKQIAAKYKFSELQNLSKEDLVEKYISLYNDFKKLSLEYEALAELNRSSEKKALPKYLGYDKSLKGIEKVLYILKENQKVLKSTEILNELVSLEPNLQLEWRSPYSAVMKYITRAIKSGRILKIKIETLGYFYALPDWCNEGGDLRSLFFRT